MNFRPTVNCRIYASRKFDMYGKPVPDYGTVSKCDIVRLSKVKKETSIRSDASASRGRADEQLYDAVLLMKPQTVIEIDNKVEINGFELKVKKVVPRYNIFGRLEHQEVSLEIWA